MEKNKTSKNKEKKIEDNSINKSNTKLKDKKEKTTQNKKKENSLCLSSNKKTKSSLNKKSTDVKQEDSTIKSAKLQEKLKNLFLEREKAKLKYNKQTLPEKLKYNSDDEESNYSSNRKQESLDKEQAQKADTIKNFFNKNINVNINSNLGAKNNQIKNKNILTNKNDEIIETKIKVNNINKYSTIRENNFKKDINEKEQKTNINKDNDNTNDKKKLKEINIISTNKEVETEIETDEFRKKYYKLLNLKTIENESNQTSEKNENKENRDITNQKEINQKKKDNDKDIGRNCKEFKKNNTTSILSLSLGDYDFNKNNKIITERDKMCAYSNSNIASDKNDKIKVLKLLELIKNKKTERELIDKTKDEIIQRSRSQAVNRKKEITPEVSHIDDNDKDKDNKKLDKTEEKKINTNKSIDNKNNENKDKDSGKDKEKDKSDKKNREAKSNMKIQRIYKKNSNINKICTSFKASNFLTESNNKIIKRNKAISPANTLNLNLNDNLLYVSNDTKNIPLNKNPQNENLYKLNNIIDKDNSNNKTSSTYQNTFYQTSNQIKPMRKYEKPKINNQNVLFNSMNNINNNNNNNINKSLPKFNKKINFNDLNYNSRYNESMVYSPKKKKIKKLNSENIFNITVKQNSNLDKANVNNINNNSINNFYVKKNLY